MYNNDNVVLVIGESGSDNATRSRIKIDATNRRNSGRLQCKNNAKFSDCFTGSRKSFSIKGRGSSVVEQPIRNRQVVGSTPTLGSRTSCPGPETWVTDRTGHMGNTFGPKRLSRGCKVFSSRSM